MSEKERMLAGEPNRPADPELVAARKRAKGLCARYNASAATHPLIPEERNSGIEMARSITIASNVWIGSGVQVLPGVTIGEGTTIGAGSVVTRDIPARCVAAGNPCRVLRRL